ncbi:MAG: hypothetical protein ABUS79_00345 [Pseudomonadota bacterium]
MTSRPEVLVTWAAVLSASPAAPPPAAPNRLPARARGLFRRAAIVAVAWAVSAIAVTAPSGCTALGPMPATTGVSAVPAARPGGEIGVGIVPGYYLSSGTQTSPGGAGLLHASLLLEPDRLIRLPGVVVGARHVGDDGNGGFFEPLAGYRCHLDDDQRIAAMAIGYFTHASGAHDGASYSATRGGAELGFDLRATPRNRAIELHANVAAALTALSASGRYCQDPVSQTATTCGVPPMNLTSVSGGGMYPSASVGLSLDFARHLGVFFHGGRLALVFSTGTMPTVIAGRQGDAHWYGSGGASLTLGFGSSR